MARSSKRRQNTRPAPHTIDRLAYEVLECYRRSLDASPDAGGSGPELRDALLDLVGRWPKPPIPGGQPPVLAAAELIQQGMERDHQTAAELGYQALLLDPRNSDAWLLASLAFEGDDPTFVFLTTARLFAAEPIVDALKELPMEEVGKLPRARPYLRVEAAFARYLFDRGDFDLAAETCARVLQLHPDDPEEVRPMYIACALLLGAPDVALEELDKCADREAAFWPWLRALAFFASEGPEAPASREALRAAYEAFPWVADLLTERASIEELFPRDERIAEFMAGMIALDMFTVIDGAEEWLRAFLDEQYPPAEGTTSPPPPTPPTPAAPPPKAKRSGPRAID